MSSTETRIRLTIRDTMAFWNEDAGDFLFNPDVSTEHAYWYRVPSSWIAGGQLPPERLEILLAHLYGPAWRAGNGDGSRYVVLSDRVEILTGTEVPTGTCYRVGPDGAVLGIAKGEF